MSIRRSKGARVSHSTEQDSRRLSRFARYSRYSRFSVKIATEHNIRKSLADYVRDELEDMDRPLFYQRVYLLAKNNTSNFKPPRSTLLKHLPTASRTDFKLVFQQELFRILTVCDEISFTTDRITGVFICMGDYTFILVESTEDMVGHFCVHLSKVASNYFITNRVLAVEDKTGLTYFEGFICRRAQPINTTEKFAPSTANDEELMREQHNIVLKKLHEVCEHLNKKITSDPATKSSHNLVRHPQTLPDLMLPPDQYNKILPEIQRIELVLNSTRFYRPVEEYMTVYTTIPKQQDEDAQAWPIPYSYTPAGVFQRLQYDVNLTFGDYGKKEAHAEQPAENSENNEAENADKKSMAEEPK